MHLFSPRVISCLPLLMLGTLSYAQLDKDFLPEGPSEQDVRRVITFSAGAARIQSGTTQTIYLTPTILKTFKPMSSNTMVIAEIFAGAQMELSSNIQGQLGLALGITNNINREGDIWEQASPDFDNYIYQYRINQSRIGLKGKLLTVPMKGEISPYVTGNVGIGLNQARAYNSTPKIVTESAQPPFDSHATTSFTYTVGAGIQKAITSHWSIGAGYEFSDLGKSSLGRAAGQTLNQGISLSHLYTNGGIISLSYVA